MSTRLVQVQARVRELDAMAAEISALAEKRFGGDNVQPTFQTKGQQWYRAARELLVEAKFSGLQDFIDCFEGNLAHLGKKVKMHTSIESIIDFPDGQDCHKDSQRLFKSLLAKARSLVLAVEHELQSRELPIATQLSFTLAADEFDKAEILFNDSQSDEVLVRVSGVLACVALERHLFTVADVRGIRIIINPPSKKKPDAEDVLNSLVKAEVITAVKKAHLSGLLAVANNCAHPREPVNEDDVQRLIRDGRAEAAAMV